MIALIVARHNDQIFNDNLKKSIDKLSDKIKVFEVPNIENDNMFKKYNRGIKHFRENQNFQDDDILVFVHEDAQLIDEYFTEKLEYIFQVRKDVGVVGFIGTQKFEDKGGWWLVNENDKDKLKGRIIQGYGNGKQSELFKEVGYYEDIVSVDGFCFATTMKVAEELGFDENTYDGWHFYDVDFCFSALQKGYKIAVVDILTFHESEGPLTQDWFDSRIKFLNKWGKKIQFPATVSSFSL